MMSLFIALFGHNTLIFKTNVFEYLQKANLTLCNLLGASGGLSFPRAAKVQTIIDVPVPKSKRDLFPLVVGRSD